jgi:hypothetical protein
MKVDVFVKLASQKLQGGIDNQDSSREIRDEDIKAYLPIAINNVIAEQYFITRNTEGIASIPDDFLTVYELDVLTDTHGVQYLQLPSSVISLPKNRGIRAITSLKGNFEIQEQTVTSRGHNRYYANSFSTTYTLVGNKIELEKLSNLVDKLRVFLIASVEDLDGNSELPVPASQEVRLMEIVFQHFFQQLQIPEDITNNNASPN